MKSCKECGNDVSRNAKTCPHCGEPNPASGGWLGWVILFIVVMMIAASK